MGVVVRCCTDEWWYATYLNIHIRIHCGSVHDTDRCSCFHISLSCCLAGAVYITDLGGGSSGEVSVTGNDFSENKAGGPGGMLLYWWVMIHYISEYPHLNGLWRCSWYLSQLMYSYIYWCLPAALFILGVEESVSVTRSVFSENESANNNGGKFIWWLWTHAKTTCKNNWKMVNWVSKSKLLLSSMTCVCSWQALSPLVHQKP